MKACFATVSSNGPITLPQSLRGKHPLLQGEVALVLDVPEGVLICHGRRALNGILLGKLDVEEQIDQIRASGCLERSSLGPSGWTVFLDSFVVELHGRIMAADAFVRGLDSSPMVRRLSAISVPSAIAHGAVLNQRELG